MTETLTSNRHRSTDQLITRLGNIRWSSKSSRSFLSRRTFDTLQTEAHTIEIILASRGLQGSSIKAIR